MTLDEAIKHCLEVAEGNDLAAGTYEILAENNHNAYERLTAKTNASRCAECAADHRQLAEWLKELTEYRKLDICCNCRHYVSGTRRFGECHATSDIEPTIVCVNQVSCETFRYKDFR